jgi:O-antigen ligase
MNLGVNGRDLELFALNEIKNVSQFIFGIGWGSLFNTPLIESPVRFVHNFFLYFYIKTGFVGFLSVLSVVIFTFIILIKVILKKILTFRRITNNIDLSISLASFSCLIYAFFFSGAFKSLSMGLILIIVICLNLKKIN